MSFDSSKEQLADANEMNSDLEHREETQTTASEKDALKLGQQKQVSADAGRMLEAVKKHILSTLPEAEPIILNIKPSNKEEETTNLFRMKGFNRNKENGQQSATSKNSRSGQDTDGDYDSGIDSVAESGKSGKVRCKHRKIEKYKCTQCDFKLERFGTYFDSGSLPNYMRTFQVSDSQEQMKELGKDVDLIYHSYQATNIIQLRDQMQTVIGKSLISHIKNKEYIESSTHSLLPKDAIYSDSIPHLKKFDEYLKNFLEMKKYVRMSDALFVDSLFESGNIERVYKNQASQEYHLFMNVDTNTRGHQQWFYFRVRNMKKNVKYKFNIWNFTKPKSLFNEGMRPVWYSKKNKAKLKTQTEQEAWEFIPNRNLVDEFKYFKSDLKKSAFQRGIFDRVFLEDEKQNEDQPMKEKKISMAVSDAPQPENKFQYRTPYYCLSFTLKFDYDDDTVFIAYSRPYKFSKVISDIVDLEAQMQKLESNKTQQSIRENGLAFDTPVEIKPKGKFTYKRSLLTLTLSGVPLPYISITASKNLGKKLPKREAIVISSRVHPGETNSSFVFQGILELLTKLNDPVAQSLRENYVFKLIPCLNPDGVIKGNYRSSFAGVDLNRQWIQPSEFMHPEIYSLKQLLGRISKDRQILLFCDLHGHSRKKNSFVYGCNRAANGGFTSWTKVRLYPRILASQNHVFDIDSCKFKVERGKLGTGRVVVWKEFDVTNSFTLENSFHGYDYGPDFKLFKIQDFKKLGSDMLHSLHKYQIILQDMQKELVLSKGWLKPKRLLEITGQTAQQILRQEARDRKLVNKTRSVQNVDKQNSKERLAERPSTSQTSCMKGTRPKPSPRYNSNQELSVVTQLLDKIVGLKKSLTYQSQMSMNTLEVPTSTEQKEKERIVLSKIIRIQSFVRMIIARNRFIEMVTQEEERKLKGNAKEPNASVLTVKDTLSDSQSNQVEEDSNSRPKEELLAPASEQKASQNHLIITDQKKSVDVKRKYLSQLTLTVIDSETADPLEETKKTQNRFKHLTIKPEGSPVPEQIEEELLADDSGIKIKDTLDDSMDQSNTTVNFQQGDWRQYFTITELTEAFSKIQAGQDPNDDEVDQSSANGEEEGSDSCPSEDNIDLKQLYDIMYCQRGNSSKILLDKKMKEEQFERNFTIFKKKVQKKMREVSKESSRSSKFQSFLLSQSHAHVHKDGQLCEKCLQIQQENNKKYTNSVKLDGDPLQRENQMNTMHLMVKGTSSKAEGPAETSGMAFNRYRRAILEAKRNSHQIADRSQNQKQDIKLANDQQKITLNVPNEKAMNEHHRRLKSHDIVNDLSIFKPKEQPKQYQYIKQQTAGNAADSQKPPKQKLNVAVKNSLFPQVHGNNDGAELSNVNSYIQEQTNTEILTQPKPERIMGFPTASDFNPNQIKHSNTSVNRTLLQQYNNFQNEFNQYKNGNMNVSSTAEPKKERQNFFVLNLNEKNIKTTNNSKLGRHSKINHISPQPPQKVQNYPPGIPMMTPQVAKAKAYIMQEQSAKYNQRYSLIPPQELQPQNVQNDRKPFKVTHISPSPNNRSSIFSSMGFQQDYGTNQQVLDINRTFHNRGSQIDQYESLQSSNTDYKPRKQQLLLGNQIIRRSFAMQDVNSKPNFDMQSQGSEKKKDINVPPLQTGIAKQMSMADQQSLEIKQKKAINHRNIPMTLFSPNQTQNQNFLQPEQRSYRSPISNQNLSMAGKTITGINQLRVVNAPLPPRQHLSPLGQHQHQKLMPGHLMNQNMRASQQFNQVIGQSSNTLQTQDEDTHSLQYNMKDDQHVFKRNQIRYFKSPNDSNRAGNQNQFMLKGHGQNKSQNLDFHNLAQKAAQNSPTTPNFIIPKNNNVTSSQKMNDIYKEY